MVATTGGAFVEGYDSLKMPGVENISKTFDAKDAGRDRTLPINAKAKEKGATAISCDVPNAGKN